MAIYPTGGDVMPDRGMWGIQLPGRGNVGIGDRRDLGRSGPSFPVGGGPGAGRVEARAMPSFPQVAPPASSGLPPASPPFRPIVRENAASPQIRLPSGQTLPPLPPQILNPPTFPTTQPKGVLDVIIDLIKPKPTNGLTKVLNPLNQGEKPMGAVTDFVLGAGQIYANYQGAKQDPFIPYNPMAAGIPFVDVIPEGPDACSVKGWVWNPSANCGAGKWQKKSRRRRRRLATHGDLKDLAALKGVLGGGKAFETWIATHGGR